MATNPYTPYGSELKFRDSNVYRAISYPHIHSSTLLGKHIMLQTALLGAILKLPIGSNEQADLFRSIRMGGTGSFTNKITSDGVFDSDVNIRQLKYNSHLIYDLALDLTKEVTRISPEVIHGTYNEYVKIYRFVETDESNTLYNTIIQPIPCSCSWSRDIVNEWGGGRKCCIYEIIIPQSSLFISSSCPFLPVTANRVSYKGMTYFLPNQEQMEVILLPCILIKLSTRLENDITIITYLSKIISANRIDDMIDITAKFGIRYQI